MDRRVLPDGSQQFETPGVARVTLRPQKDAKQVTINLDPAPSYPSQPDFQLIRLIGNLCAKGPAGSLETTFAFDPPLEVQFSYTVEEDQAARSRGKPLALAYWDGGRWVRFPRVSFATARRLATVQLDQLGDPPIGWGT